MVAVLVGQDVLDAALAVQGSAPSILHLLRSPRVRRLITFSPVAGYVALGFCSSKDISKF